MKRLIKKSNIDMDKTISDLSTFLSKGIDSLSGRGYLSELVDNIIQTMPSLSSSGVFYRGLILDYSIYDFQEKMPKVNNFINELEQFMDDNELEDIKVKQNEYKNTPIPSDFINEIKSTCMNEIKIDGDYYSFAKDFESCKTFIFDAAPDAYDGDIYIIFECSTSGLDIEKLNESINDLNISEENKNKFLSAYKDFGYQKEVICRMEDINMRQFQYLDFNKDNSIYDLLTNFLVDVYV